jgi:metallo-beta-lactamase family protein
MGTIGKTSHASKSTTPAKGTTLATLDFYGAASTVTGSKTLLTHNGHRLLVDCGLFQGHKNLRQLNWIDLPFEPKRLSAVVLTHAHLDHAGALPLLVKQGFCGPIYASAASIDVATVLLLDSAKLQQEEANYNNRHHTTKHHPARPLYDVADVQATVKLFEPLTFDDWHNVLPDISIKLQRASHILGAAFVRVHAGEREVVFSGDLGRAQAPILGAPDTLGPVDYIVMESTYGNRHHPNEDPKLLLASIINATVRRGGAVLIPAFAVGRAQVLMHAIHDLIESEQIPPLPVFLDSPMAINVTKLYQKHHADHQLSAKQIKAVFDVAQLVDTVEASKALNALKYPRIIISASGMATGGRVLHHIRTLIGDHRNAIVFGGFQAAGTRGARLVAGEPTIRVFGQDLEVRAEIHSIEGFSAHADADQLLDWLDSAGGSLRQVFLNHGEPTAADTLRQRVEHELGLPCQVPLLGQQFALV